MTPGDPAALKGPCSWSDGAAIARSSQQRTVRLARATGGTSTSCDRIEERLALYIMRAHFTHGTPKGTLCCPPCTLAIYPLLGAGLIRWFDGPALAPGVRSIVVDSGRRFTKLCNPRLIAWSIGTS